MTFQVIKTQNLGIKVENQNKCPVNCYQDFKVFMETVQIIFFYQVFSWKF